MRTEILEMKKKIIENMTKYMNFGCAEDENDSSFDPDFEAGYEQDHVDQCAKIIDDLFVNLTNAANSKKVGIILKAVKEAVLKLNELNENCDYSLIETDQREDLCELINAAAIDAGLDSDDNDITEEWREW